MTKVSEGTWLSAPRTRERAAVGSKDHLSPGGQVIVTGQMQRSGVELEVLLGGEAYLVKLLSLSSSQRLSIRAIRS